MYIKMPVNHQIISIVIIYLTAHQFTTTITSASPLPTIESLGTAQTLDYAQQPNEVLPIQPLLLYPLPRNLQLQGRELDDDDDDDNNIIYVKLLKRKAYRPTKQHLNGLDGENNEPRELTMKDIFYVKALANGQFSHQRLKLYRLPEFYAISVFRSKGAKL